MQRRVACIQSRRIVVARRYDEVGQNVKAAHGRQLTAAGVTNGQGCDAPPIKPYNVCLMRSFASRTGKSGPVSADIMWSLEKVVGRYWATGPDTRQQRYRRRIDRGVMVGDAGCP